MFKRLLPLKITLVAALALPLALSLTICAAAAADFASMNTLQLTAAAQNEWKHKRCEKATVLCDELIRREPGNPLAYQIKAGCIDYLDGPERAIALLEGFLKTHNHDEQSVMDLGQYYFSVNQYEKAIACFTEVMKLNPNGKDAYHMRSIAYAALKQYDAGIRDLDEYLKRAPKHGRGYEWRADAYKQTGQWGKAIADLDRAILFSPDKSNEFITERADLYVKLKQYEKAVTDYDRAIKLNPADDVLWFKKGQALVKLGQYQKAADAFSQTIALNESSTAYFARSAAYEKLNRRAEALKDKAIGDKLEKKRAVERL